MSTTVTTTNVLPGQRRACDPELAQRRRLCCGIFAVISGVAGIAVVVTGAILGVFYLTGPGITLIVWGVICGSAAYRYGYYLRNPPQANATMVQTNNVVLPAYLRQQTPGNPDPVNAYAPSQPGGFVQTQPQFGQNQYATQYSSPYTFSQPGGNMPAPPPTYDSVILSKDEKL